MSSDTLAEVLSSGISAEKLAEIEDRLSALESKVFTTRKKAAPVANDGKEG